MVKLYFVCAVLVCSLYAGSEKEAIAQAIVAYNHGVIEAAKSGKTGDLAGRVSDEKLLKLFVWIQSWHENGLVMEASFDRIRFYDHNISDTKASVTTDEQWRHRYYNTRKQRYEQEQMTHTRYTNRYHFDRHAGVWVITDIVVLDEQKVGSQPQNDEKQGTKE